MARSVATQQQLEPPAGQLSYRTFHQVHACEKKANTSDYGP